MGKYFLHALVNQDAGLSFVKQIEQWPRTWRGPLIENATTHIATHSAMTKTKTHTKTKKKRDRTMAKDMEGSPH